MAAMYQCPATLTSVTTWLSDDTWTSLDPTAGRLNRSGRRALIGGLVGAAAVLAAVGLGFGSGVLAPRLSLGPFSTRVDAPTHSYVLTATVHNEGKLTERIVSVGAAMPGVRARLDSVRPSSVPAGGSARLAVRVTVTHCEEAEGNDSPPIKWALRVDRPWGAASARFPGPSGYGDGLFDSEVIQSACGHSG
jgi:hypothetical protein